METFPPQIVFRNKVVTSGGRVGHIAATRNAVVALLWHLIPQAANHFPDLFFPCRTIRVHFRAHKGFGIAYSMEYAYQGTYVSL